MNEDFDTNQEDEDGSGDEEAIAGELKRLRSAPGKEEGGFMDKAATAITAPARKGTDWLLRSAWESISTVWGFVFLGLPYINLHVLGGMTLGEKFFGKLGSEWQSAFGGVANAFGQSESKGINLVEKIALVVFDVVLFVCIIAIIAAVIIIIDFTTGIFGWFAKLYAGL
ncbi:hypothetical protein A2303_02295 [Candidatus Falkowbacteria bacterium RIFOXYB2_FULL_47_14]|uniref:Uncharacterized protein n=1 Tax=Candidatus Falkowbacteria bacterium RIFOXYA2_FULL_47_19 TaxID=1797994 RepID=A0A1F5SEM1_9BACT|nr:MAG: hypothetical protein A2227_07470 [Candidatus Falkowbacteria bacterium RIFOXYA2_FULL_47_19]OGF35251.1 MAG: hypothetical protein A2468_01105 [Candidatus Falkowbacteria bacterium RIFOXYC2_FULL_46_15]OGF43893.1 MAG: hypothetical protein A2303_02295 [Candidatus Falkowbacteria bacterium RIFOXYB2_FULL_47_14]